MHIFDTILKVITLPMKIIIAIFLFSIAIIIMPKEWLEILGLTTFVAKNIQWITLVSLFTASLIIVNIGYGLIKWIKACVSKLKRKAQENIKKENIDKKLLDLDHTEKSVLREFIIKRAYTIKLPVMEPPVTSLIESSILESVGNFYMDTICGPLYNIKINEYVKDRLTNEMFGLPNTEDLTEKEEQWIHNNRPHFMEKLERLKVYGV